MKQYSIFDAEMQVSKRLVRNDLTSLQWRLLDYLKEYALGEENAVGGRELKYKFNLKSTAEVRKIIKTLRTSPQVNLIIGSNNKGYYIPFKDEYIKSVTMVINRALSGIETAINLMPSIESVLHKAIGYYYKKADKGSHNQEQIQFNGWEQVINRFAEKYKGEEK